MLFGIPIRVHFSLVLLLIALTFFAASRSANALLPVVVVAVVFISVVLHELGHALAARSLGIETQEIVLYPIGGVARLQGLPRGVNELCIAAAGPSVNFALAAVGALLMVSFGYPWTLSQQAGIGQAVCTVLLQANLGLFVFNLLPAFPMDGGRILRSLLSLVTGDDRATRLAAGIGQVLAIVLGLFALLGPPQGLLLLVVAFFVFIGAGQEASFNRTLAVLRGRTAAEAMMTRFETLAPQDSLEWAARLFLATHQRDFPVVDAWGRVAGMLDRASMLRALAVHGPAAAVLEAMQRSPETVPPEAPLEDVLRRLQAQRGGAIVVEDESGVLGMVTIDKLTAWIDVVQRLRAGAARSEE